MDQIMCNAARNWMFWDAKEVHKYWMSCIHAAVTTCPAEATAANIARWSANALEAEAAMIGYASI